MIDYKIGDEYWYVPTGFLLAIKCKITDIDTSFKDKEPQAYLFMELDEPTGHCVVEWELIEHRDRALNKLLESAFTDFDEEIPINTLTQYRLYHINFIIDTHEELSKLQKL